MQIMFKLQILLLTFLAAIAMTSCDKACDKDNAQSEDYLIFGHFHGFCVGEKCIETFKLEDNELYEDTKDQYRGLTGFNFIKLPDSKYKLAKELVDFVPQELWAELDGKVFGCPDCYDQGGYLIQERRNGITKSWIFDKTKKDIPSYMHVFIDKISETIVLINQ